MLIINGDCIEEMRKLDDNSVDSIVTDPPYELGFMGKSWDSAGIAYNIDVWREALRVLKPGGHLVAFSGTRTYHRMACAIEDAGFEIRDQMQWLYGSGMPHGQDISKAINKKEGAKRPLSEVQRPIGGKNGVYSGNGNKWQETTKEPQTENAIKWSGWNTALRPANEPIVVARKPLSEKTVVANVMRWGTGGLNIDKSRIVPQGRFPANVLFDESAAAILDEQSGVLKSGKVKPEGFKGDYKANVYGKFANNCIDPSTVYGDSGGASRFFYCSKASKRERGEDNVHPTVKPLKLMEYLVTLVTPPNGTVLDPFAGSGTTGIAAKNKGFDFIGIEQDAHYCEIARGRIG